MNVKVKHIRAQQGYTLVEILIVLAVIAILAAILLPAFATVRGKARQATCASNLRQLGMAITQYTADYDHFPRGLDPADSETPQIWSGVKTAQGVVLGEVRLLPDVLDPYVKNRQLWHCPSDIGFDMQELTNTPLDARPSSFDKFGMSYFYRTELTFLNLSEDRVLHPDKTNVLSDGDGAWHGASILNLNKGRRNNVLFADGHVKSLNPDDYFAAWTVPLQENGTVE
jgi:general secretion pathway protein G